jgi:hypothetical protein
MAFDFQVQKMRVELVGIRCPLEVSKVVKIFLVS